MPTARLTLTAAAATAAVAALPSAAQTLVADPTAFVDWWTNVGTGAATIALLHLVVTVGFAYVAALAGLVTVADGLRLRSLRRLLLRLATPTVRRWITVGVIAGSVAVPAPVLAEESIVSVTDLGPVAETIEPAVLVTDLGPVAAPVTGPTNDVVASDDRLSTVVPSAALRDSFRPPNPAAVADAWLVESGDNLWSIAATVVSQHDGHADEASVARYWHALIEANRSGVADPDLIFPGQVLTLPPVTTAGS